MILTSSPADFASAYKDNYFSFEEVDPSEPVEVLFYDESEEVVGVRRFAGLESLATSPKAFLLRRLSPEPVENSACLFVLPDSRTTSLAVEYNYGDDMTPAILFTSAHHDCEPNSPMGDKEQWRTISAGECDEMAFSLDEGGFVRASLVVGGTPRALIGAYTAPKKCVALFVLNVNYLLSRGLVPEGCKEFDVEFSIGGEPSTTIHYRLRTSHPSDVRLAWLNEWGGVSYHTFHSPVGERLRTERKVCETPSGSVVLGVESWIESALDSGMLAEGESHHLAELLTSPRVWRKGAEGFEPQIITSSEATMVGGELRRVSLVVRPAKRALNP